MSGDPIQDPINKGLEQVGIKVEPREATAVEQMVASGVGGIAGSVIGSMAGLGWIGRALASLAGAVAGHLVITHRIVRDPTPEGREPGHEPR